MRRRRNSSVFALNTLLVFSANGRFRHSDGTSHLNPPSRKRMTPRLFVQKIIMEMQFVMVTWLQAICKKTYKHKQLLLEVVLRRSF